MPPAESPPEAQLPRVRVWDLPTRLFHWTLVLAVVGSVASAKIGGNAMSWHFRFGILIIGLLLFRLVWGFVGGHWSRFASFFYSPTTVWRYVRGRHGEDENLDVGHNPLGSLSVWALLAFLLLQTATGLVADDEIASIGPLNPYVSAAVAGLATSWHKAVGQRVILLLIALHIGAIVYYLVRKKINLVAPMLHGDKLARAGTPAALDTRATRLRALGVAALSASVAGALLSLL